jgi:GTP-binding protein Era
MDIIFKEIRKVLPEGPKYYPDDQLTDQPEKFIVAELIREKVLRFLSEEVPHGVGIEIISFKEKPEQDMVSIQANIYCEKDSHKGIIIGRNGKMLKKIGTLAREETEKMLGAKVFLELWVKVKPDWRNNNNVLRTLGYTE